MWTRFSQCEQPTSYSATMFLHDPFLDFLRPSLLHTEHVIRRFMGWPSRQDGFRFCFEGRPFPLRTTGGSFRAKPPPCRILLAHFAFTRACEGTMKATLSGYCCCHPAVRSFLCTTSWMGTPAASACARRWAHGRPLTSGRPQSQDKTLVHVS